jgi:hypothetical protein
MGFLMQYRKGAGLKVERVEWGMQLLCVFQIVADCPDVTVTVVECGDHDRFITLPDDGVYKTTTSVINIIVIHITPRRLNKQWRQPLPS